MKRGIRILASLLLVFLLAATVSPGHLVYAAEEELPEDEAIMLLQEHGLVKGDPQGNLLLNDKLTRAQAATLFVRAAGVSDLADVLASSVTFSDAKGHWAAGEIALARNLGLMNGDGNGLFRPDDEITYVEIMTVLLRMVEQEPGGPWNPDGIMSKAKSLDMVPSDVEKASAAIRRKVFWALAATLTEVPVDDDSTLMRRHFDRTPPALVLNTPNSSVTNDDEVTITGRAQGAFRVVINGKKGDLDKATGEFKYRASLDIGLNTFVVEATDRARNSVSKTITVERRGTVSRLRVSGPDTLRVQSKQKLEVTALDSRGNELPLTDVEITATVSGDVATFDVKSRTLSTGTKTGRGTLTLEAGRARATHSFEVVGPSSKGHALRILEINKGHAPALNKDTVVTVQVVDENGKVVTDDDLRSVNLKVSGLSRVSIEGISPNTERGVATFKVRAQTEGIATLTATASGIESDTVEVQFLDSPRIALTTTTKSLSPDGVSTATMKATLMDDNGRPVSNNTRGDIQIELNETGTDGEITQAFLSIPRGRNTSTNTATYQVGIAPGTARITGRIVSDHDYPIQPLNLPVDSPLAGEKFLITYSPSNPEPGDLVTVTLKVVDSRNRTVTAGSYAFLVKLSTSNNDPIVNGIPDGVEFSFKDSPYYPVDDGYKETHRDNDPYSVTGRTEKGVAVMTLRYNRSGSVEIKPVPVGSSYDAYSPESAIGPASPSTGLYAPAQEIAFSGDADAIVLAIDSALGRDFSGGVVDRATQMTVRVKVVDSSGAPVPGYRQNVTLSRSNAGDGVTYIVGSNRKLTTDGVAEFTIQASNTQGFDQYTASVGSLSSGPVTVSVRKERTEAPIVVAVRGIQEGDLSPVTGYVGPEADYMQVQLAPQKSNLPGEPTNWVIAKVYRKGETRPFFTSDAIDVASSMPMIRIPRSVLKIGTYYYEVVLDNGAGDSPRSLAIDDHTMAKVVDYSSQIRLTNASYDAKTTKLTLTGRGFNSKGVLDLSKLQITNGPESLPLDDPSVTINSISSSTITLLLNEYGESLSPDLFHGSRVFIQADTGWYSSSDGTQVAEEYSDISVSPMAVIHSAAIDNANKRLYLFGDGFKQGNLNVAAIYLTDGTSDPVALRPGSSSSSDRVTSTTDNQVIVNLSQATYEAISELTGAPYIQADVGWLYSGSSSSGPKVGAIQGESHLVYAKVWVSSASFSPSTGVLTLKGQGLEGLTVDPTKLSFRRSTTSTSWKVQKPATVINVTDTEVQIEFHADDAADFHSTFAGRTVYVNTEEGWAVDSQGREVLTVPTNSILFTVPSK